MATDTLHEALLLLLKRRPLQLLPAFLSLTRGRAAFKRKVCELVRLDPAALPYRNDVLDFLEAEHKKGTHLVLATAADQRVADAIADHIGLFDEVIASDGKRNEKGRTKAERLLQLSQDGAFDYVGDSHHDLPVWKVARTAYVVAPSRSLLRRLTSTNVPGRVFPSRGSRLGDILRALRPHQWAKNLLLMVPLITSHKIGDPALLSSAGLGFFAFSMLASAGYVLNDLLDLDADRAHPVKCQRPFASGRLTPLTGVAAFVMLVGLGMSVATAFLSGKFVALLLAYFVATVSYSVYLKSKLLLDVILLAGLYTLRVLAGGAAVNVVVSQWLLGFSMFIFLSLAFAKRYAELRMLLASDKTKAMGRGYRVEEMDLVLNVGTTSGFLSVLVFSLYINSGEVRQLYQNVDMLWFTCPVFLYWILRIWFLARRGELPGDPVTFALRDRHSLIAALLLLATVLAAAVL